MRKILEYARMAYRNIMGSKMRSLLTMLGIIIGIGAVIMVLYIGGGGKNMMSAELGSLSSGSVFISVGGMDSVYNDYFTDADIDAINRMPGIAGTTMASGSTGSVRSSRTELTADISCGNGSMPLVFPTTLLKGRFWNDSDYHSARRVITIDSDAAKELFGTDDVLGMSLPMTIDDRTADFTIVGITKSESGYSYNGTVVAAITVPISSLLSICDYIGEPYYQLAFLAEDPSQSISLGQQALSLIQSRHDNADRDCYSLIDVSQYTEQINSVVGMFTGVIAVVAGISLLVGGIGVMNIMLVSVTERTREIGIRKALGAKTGSITFQFLIEAGTLTFIGGLIGIAVGIWGGYGICSLLGMEGEISPVTVIQITLFSVAVGIFFGIYPARKAAKLSPIEALRTE